MAQQPIPFNNLSTSWLASDEVASLVSRVVRSGWYVLGPENWAFEECLCEYLDVPFAAGVASGTDALAIALQALGCREGSLVAVTANAGGYASIAARSLGCDLVYVDVVQDTHLMDLHDLAEVLSIYSVDAVVVTHLYGAMARVADIVELAHDHGAVVVEDCAQALGAERNGRRAGSFGDAAAFSFYPTKNLGALGDGGAVVTHDRDTIDRVKELRQYGWRDKYLIATKGGRNSRLDEIQAAVLCEGLKHLDGWNERRREILRRYVTNLKEPTRMVTGIGGDSTAHLAVLEVDSPSQRRSWQADLAKQEIGTDIHYPFPDHEQVGLAPRHPRPLTNTDSLRDRVFSIPCYPGLLDSEIDRIAAALARFDEEGSQHEHYPE